MKIAIVGLGYVGLPLSLQFVKGGAQVVGIDIDPSKIARLNSGESYIKHIPPERIREAKQSGRLVVTSDVAQVHDCTAIVLCVPTPLTKNREPDLSYVVNSAAAIAPYIQRGCLVALESSTYPGTTEGILRETLEQRSKMKAGKDFHLAFSPEREDPGNPASKVGEIPKVVGGLTEKCLEMAVSLYQVAVKSTVPVSSCRVAEATKLLENIFRSVNIALVNELKVVYTAMNVDIWEAIEAAKTKPFGFMPFYPGPGLGGHCIPIDPFYLTWKAREFGLNTRFIELAGEINTYMPNYVIGKICEVLNREGKPLLRSRVLLLGLAYKPNVDDDRESPTYIVMEKLEALGAVVSYSDPHIPEVRPTREHMRFVGRRSVSIVPENFDVIVIMTAHKDYQDLDFSELSIPVVDTRNCIRVRSGNYHRA